MKPRLIALWVLVSVVIVTALAWMAHGWDSAWLSTGEFWFWLGLTLGAECLWLRTPGGSATISMASCAHFAALLVLPPAEAMTVVAAASALAESLVLKKPLPRVAFNAFQAAIAVGLARLCYAALGPQGPQLVALLSPGHYLALAAAGGVYYVANHGATALAVGLDRGISPVRVWRDNFGVRYEAFSSATLFCLGVLLAAQYQAAGAMGVVPLVLPVVLAKDGYDRFLRSLERTRARQAAEGPPPESDDPRRKPADAA